MSTRSKYLAILGPIAYVGVWLLILPVVAEVSVRIAVMGLTFFTAFYCFLIAQLKHRDKVLWGVLGGLAGFVELGLIPVLIISVLSSNYAADGDVGRRSVGEAT